MFSCSKLDSKLIQWEFIVDLTRIQYPFNVVEIHTIEIEIENMISELL